MVKCESCFGAGGYTISRAWGREEEALCIWCLGSGFETCSPDEQKQEEKTVEDSEGLT